MVSNFEDVVILHELGGTADYSIRDQFYDEITNIKWEDKIEIKKSLLHELEECQFKPFKDKSIIKEIVKTHHHKNFLDNSYLYPFNLYPEKVDDILKSISNLKFENTVRKKEIFGDKILDIISKETKCHNFPGTYWLTEAQEDNKKITSNKLFQEIAFDPTILNIVGKYLGATPIHVSTNLWFSTPTQDKLEQSQNAQQFHQDAGFLSFVKVFIYLTDTFKSNGAHWFIPASNRDNHNELLENYVSSKRIDDFTLEKIYQKENISCIEGKAGTVVFGDTSCFHKGGVVEEGFRLILNLEYTTSLFGSSMKYFNSELNKDVVKNYPENIRNRMALNYQPKLVKQQDKYKKSFLRKFSTIVKKIINKFKINDKNI